MKFNNILNELEDIPITTFKQGTTDGADSVTPREQEVDKTPSRFSLNSYSLKKGTLTAKSEEELDAKVDAFIEKTKNRMAVPYNYSSDNRTAYIVYFDKDVSEFDGKYKTALQNKIDKFVQAHSHTDVKPELEKRNSVSNIQKAIESLSVKSMQDLQKYIGVLQTRDKYDR